MSFTALKESSGKFDQLQTELEKINNPAQTTSFSDDRFWRPELDKSGNGYAVIRFLPQPDGEDLPWARVWSHAFSGPGGWYIENSLTTVNKKDPVSEYNTELWNSGIESDKEIARKQKRVLKYFANILVISDQKHPENEGKVFLFRFGKKIFDKLTEAMSPQFEDEEALNPFDMWSGANFKLKIRKVDGFWNYDKSEFATANPISTDDDELEKLWSKQHSLVDFVAPDKFKPYDELKEKLHRILTGSGVGKKTAESFTKKEAEVEVEKAFPEKTSKEDDTLSYFAKLAEDES